MVEITGPLKVMSHKSRERWPRSFGQCSEIFEWSIRGNHAADLIAGSVAKYASWTCPCMTGQAVTLRLENLLAGETRVVSDISGRCVDATCCSGEHHNGQVLQRRSGVGLGRPRHVIALHRFDEALGHSIALRTSHGCRDGLQADLLQERQRPVGNVAGSVVAQPLDFVVSLQLTGEAVFDSLEHHVAHHVAVVPARGRSPTHGFPVAAVQREDDAQGDAVVAAKFETVRTPADVAPVHRNLAVVSPHRRGMARPTFEQHAVATHDAITRLALTRGWLSASRFRLSSAHACR